MLLRNEKLLILSIPFRARIGYTDNFEDLKHEFWAIENWLKFKLRSAPQAVSRAFFTGNDFWFMDTYQAMTYTAYSSAAIALISSALVIFISSRSVALTVFSVVSILYILAATTATMVALGWTLGFLECICIAILIGISADFVTHLSAAYTADKGNVDRKERTQRALVSMGPSILAAAFTTTASSVVMIFTVIVFFHKFAFVLLITIIHSTSGAFIFFCTLTNCLGPCEPGQFVKRTTKYINRMFQIARDLSTQSSKTHMKKIGAEERAS